MSKKNLVTFLILSLLLVGCADIIATEPIVVTENPGVPTVYPGPIVSTIPAYPEPTMETPRDNQTPVPEPGTPAIPPSDYEPQPGDESLKRGQVFLDLASSRIISTATEPGQVSVILQGNLPDPCHLLRVVVTPPYENRVIQLEAYSLLKPGGACITVLEPFTATIPLGNYPGSLYVVIVNGEKLGEFGTSYDPQPGDASLKRDKVFMDMENSSLLIMESYPIQVRASLVGSLSDPCHQLRIVVTPAEAVNQINLEVYSVFDPNKACITVIQPFNVSIPLGSYKDGHFSVYVNGELLGEFDA
jgi:hypothetical protein